MIYVRDEELWSALIEITHDFKGKTPFSESKDISRVTSAIAYYYASDTHQLLSIAHESLKEAIKDKLNLSDLTHVNTLKGVRVEVDSEAGEIKVFDLDTGSIRKQWSFVSGEKITELPTILYFKGWEVDKDGKRGNPTINPDLKDWPYVDTGGIREAIELINLMSKK